MPQWALAGPTALQAEPLQLQAGLNTDTTHTRNTPDDSNTASSTNSAITQPTGSFPSSSEELTEVEKDAPPLLTQEENFWLLRHPLIRLGVDRNWPPFESLTPEGNYSGITADYVRWLKSEINFSTEKIIGFSRKDLLSAVASGEADVFPGIMRTAALEKYLRFTKPYLRIPMVVIAPESTPFVNSLEDFHGKTIVAEQGKSLDRILERDFPGIKVILVSNLEEARTLIMNGKADALFTPLAGFSRAPRDVTEGLKVVATSPYTYDLSFGVRRDWPALSNILDKILASDRARLFYNEWGSNTPTAARVDWNTVWKLLFAVLCAVGLVVVLIVCWNRRLAKEVKERKQVQEALGREIVERIQIEKNLHREIAERKQAEALLISSQQRVMNILESLPGAVSLKDMHNRYLLANAGFCTLMGLTVDEVIGKELGDFITHTDSDIVLKNAARQTLETGLPVSVEHAEITGDGVLRHLLSTLLPFADENGRHYAVLTQTTDVSEIKSMEVKLRETATLASIAFDLAKAGYWRIPLDHPEGMEMSERVCSLLGLALREDNIFHVRHDCYPHVKSVEPAAAHDLLRQFSELFYGRRTTLEATYPFKRPDNNQVVWLHSVGRTLCAADGTPTAVYGVTQDITEYKEAEAQLLAAKDQAEAAVRAKSAFLANMSHEIRTPLNAIIGMNHLIAQTTLTKKQQNYLCKIDNSAKALLRLLNDILDFSKIEAGRFEIERVRFSLEDVFRNLSNAMRGEAEKKGLTLTFKTNPDVPDTLLGDPFRLGQILLNLTDNAVKFTDHGSIKITAECDPNARSKGEHIQLLFTVRDTGIGMDSLRSELLFESFTQHDNSTTRKYGGTGLGLAICKQLTELLGGTIRVKSTQGEGSTFSFTARFEQGAQAAPGPQINKAAMGLHLLVVEDVCNEDLRQDLASISTQVDFVSGENDALRLAQQTSAQEVPYDAILLDVNMPEMKGLETARLLRSDSRTSKIPLVIMADDKEMEKMTLRATSFGIRWVVPKPLNTSSLLDVIMNATGLQPSNKPGATRAATSGLSFGVTSSGAISEAACEPQEAALMKAGTRILLVEDNMVNQLIALEILKSEGAVVDIASNGLEAVSKVNENPYDLILMDIQMPEMDGIEATRKIREDPRFKDLPIIAMTAHAMSSDRKTSLDAGMNAHVTKPIDPPTLFATLAFWLNPHGKKAPQIEVPTTPQPTFDAAVQSLNTEQALRRLAGNRNLYINLLTDFQNSVPELKVRLATALAGEDTKTLKYELHSLKGVSASLGAENVALVAASAEKALMSGDIPALRLLEHDLFAELDTTLTQMAAFSGLQRQANLPDKGYRAQANNDELTLLVQQILPLIQQQSPEATEAFMPLKAELEASHPDEVNAIDDALYRFAFDEALQHLTALCKKTGVDPDSVLSK